MLDRRRLVLALGAGLLAPPARAAPEPGRDPEPDLEPALARIEAESGGRLGVAILDAGSGRVVGHRADERFPLCSTFKLLAAAAILARVEAGRERLERSVPYTAAMIVPDSPVTQARLGTGGLPAGEGAMPLDALCAAAITRSDNTAGNLLLDAIGGPAGLTAYLRGLGDPVTRLDRIEPDLNEAAPGDPRDTTTPAAMLASLRRLLLGDALSPDGRARLTGWLLDNRTGDARLRARLPPGWRVGDKTGSGAFGTTNDVGLIRPPDGAPILAAIYLTQTTAAAEARNATVAAVGRVLAGLRPA
ncbi:class A beta-lactamase [Methylobacterium sp. A54F]